MRMQEFVSLLRKNGYRDTQPRRLVLEAMSALKEPASPYDIQKKIGRKAHVSTVTVYRVTEMLESLGLVHRHPCSGKLSLCEHPGESGLHGYLHCHDCGSSEEFCSAELGDVTRMHARRKGFAAESPLLEIVGTCRGCS